MKKLSLIFVFIIFISLNSCSSNTKYFGSSNIKIDQTGVVNFIRYLEGRFYAENTIIDRSSRIMSPMYYAISEDGKNGYGWFCNSTSTYHCNDNFLAFKTVEYCKEYSRKNCHIFAIRNEIVWKNLNIRVDELGYSKNVELFKKLAEAFNIRVNKVNSKFDFTNIFYQNFWEATNKKFNVSIRNVEKLIMSLGTKS